MPRQRRSVYGDRSERLKRGTHSRLTADLLGLLSEIRAEIAKEVVDSKEAAAIRAALMRLFDGFVLHRGSPGPEAGEGTKVAYWLEPVLGQHQMGGYVDRLRTKLRTTGSGFPIGEPKTIRPFQRRGRCAVSPHRRHMCQDIGDTE
jgi:hypothetical protein